MRAFQFLTEAEVAVPKAVPAGPKNVGREFNHLEDLTFSQARGGLKAIEVLKYLSQDASDVAMKWDGNPTVYWGRDDDGTFRMVGKNNWGREEGKSSSPEELEQFIMSRGKGEDWRPKFAKDMGEMWKVFEDATPSDFRGYVYGDILFHPGKPYQGADGAISFTPNQTTYRVKRGTEDFEKIAGKKVGVAAHKVHGYFGDKSGVDFTKEQADMFSGSKDLVVYGQTYVSRRPEVNADNLSKIEALVNKYQADIDRFLTPITGLGYLQDTIYQFVNNQSKMKQLDQLNTQSFYNWLNQKAPTKGKKISEHAKNFGETFDGLFQIVTELMRAKDDVIADLDSSEGGIVANTQGKPGGEGYVVLKYKVKLVPRDRWTPFRSD